MYCMNFAGILSCTEKMIIMKMLSHLICVHSKYILKVSPDEIDVPSDFFNGLNDKDVESETYKNLPRSIKQRMRDRAKYTEEN